MMETNPYPPSGLYPKLLGDSWRSLGDAIQRLHASGGTIRAVGTFRVQRGSNWLTRMLVWFMRMSAAGEAVDIQLVVTTRDNGEEWHRRFAGRPLVSMQSGRADGLLAERMGLTEIRFQLEVVDAVLHYTSRSAALCLGPWRIPLPSWLSPRVRAWERAGGGQGQLEVSVEVSLPMLGRLISYRGPLALAEVPA